MSTFLQIASRVEAAVEAYISVQDFSDREAWKEMLQREKVSAHLRGISITVYLK
jgi:hypothetical protein